MDQLSIAGESVAPPSGPIPVDLPCDQCGYNLRTMTAADRCPECGNHVRNTLARVVLWGRPEETRSLQGAVTWLAFSSLLTVISVSLAGLAIVLHVHILRWRPWDAVLIGPVLTLIGTIALICHAYELMERGTPTLRLVLMATAVVGTPAMFTFSLPFLGMMFVTLFLGLSAGAASFAAAMARRMSDRATEAIARALSLGFVACWSLGCLNAVVEVVAGFLARFDGDVPKSLRFFHNRTDVLILLAVVIWLILQLPQAYLMLRLRRKLTRSLHHTGALQSWLCDGGSQRA